MLSRFVVVFGCVGLTCMFLIAGQRFLRLEEGYGADGVVVHSMLWVIVRRWLGLGQLPLVGALPYLLF